MAVNWPLALVAELAARRCIVFLGAGASAGSLSSKGGSSPPLWHKFIGELISALPSGTDLSMVNDLLEKKSFLDAAEIVMGKITPADFSRVVREQFVYPKFEASKIHESVLNIDPKIVVTTNYDDIYDNYCRSGMARDGYNVCRYYDKHLVNDLRSPVRLIIKAHGCVSDAAQIILTRSQYFNGRQGNGSFYSVLDALFVTNTILFVGYGLSDPDIQLVLENSNIAARSCHKHYALIEDGMHPDIEQAVANAYNIQFIKYGKGDHAQAEDALIDLSSRVVEHRALCPA